MLKNSKHKHIFDINRIMWIGGAVCLALSILMFILLFSLRYDKLWFWYDPIQQKLGELEEYIMSIDSTGLFIGAIVLLFVIKTVFPIYMTSTVCFITAAVLPVYLSIPVNILGITVLLTIRYFFGKRFGAGNAWKVIIKNENLRRLIQRDGKGNEWLLVALRGVPSIPVNTVSGIYGSFDFGYFKFIAYSLLGFFPRILFYTLAGRNIYNPLSAAFLAPIIILLFITGISVLSFNGLWVFIDFFTNYMKHRKDEKGEDNEEF